MLFFLTPPCTDDEHDIDASACDPIDLSLPEAACVNSEWEGWVMEATNKADRRRGKALRKISGVVAGYVHGAAPPHSRIEVSSLFHYSCQRVRF